MGPLGHHHRDIGAKKDGGDHAHCGDDIDVHFVGLAGLLLAGPGAGFLACSSAPCSGLFRGFG